MPRSGVCKLLAPILLSRRAFNLDGPLRVLSRTSNPVDHPVIFTTTHLLVKRAMAGFVHDPYDELKLTVKTALLELGCGGLAGSFGIFVGIPFDLVKVRMQSMPEKYKTMTQTFKLTVREDGFVGLYRGMMAPIGSQVFINAVVFASESATLKYLEPHLKPGEVSQSRVNHFIAGMVAGATQCVVLVPTDVVKCRMQLDSSKNLTFIAHTKKPNSTTSQRSFSTAAKTTYFPSSSSSSSFSSRRQHSSSSTPTSAEQPSSMPKKQFKGSIDCGIKIFQNEGITGLYKGFSVTALRELPSIGVYFSVYRFLREQIDERLGPAWQTTSTVVAGGLAGCCSWSVVYPLDVIKTNIQVHSFISGGNQGGILQTARALYQKSGYQTFYRGIGPTMMRAFPVNGITFLCYENLKKAAGLYD